jgi:hypothetical protein
MMVTPEEENQALESIPLSEAEIVPTVRAINDALVFCFNRFGPSGKEDVADTLRFKTKERGLEKHLEKHPGANPEFVKQVFLEVIAALELESTT